MPATGPQRGARFTTVMAAARQPFGLNRVVSARLAASACECVYMYAAMRWLVFRDVASPADQPHVPRQPGRAARRLRTRQCDPCGPRRAGGDGDARAAAGRPHCPAA